MRIRPLIRAAILPALLTLGLCVFLTFSLQCNLVVDGHGNMGDETMSIALAGQVPIGPLPGYGYRPSGAEWKFDANTSPFYGWFYGPAIGAVSPLMRVPAARLVSRILSGLALAFLTWSVLLIVFHRSPASTPLWGQLLLVTFLSIAYLNSPRFRFVASFARVDALGLFFLAAVLAAGARLLTKPSPLSAFLFSLLALSSALSSYVAFYLIGFVASFCLVAFAIEQMRGKTAAGALRALLVSVVLPGAVALVLFVGLSAINRGSFSGLAGGALTRMLNTFLPSRRVPSQVQALAKPDRWRFIAASLAGLAILIVRHIVIRRGQRPLANVSTRLSDLLWIAAAIGGTGVVYTVWLLMLGSLSVRYTYDVLITTAFAFLQLLVFCFVLRNRQTERYVMATTTLAALFYVTFQTGYQQLPGCVEDAPPSRQRLWPKVALQGFYNPFDDGNEPGNQARRKHAEAVRDYFIQHHIQKALATDPMFTTMSDPLVTFYFLNDSYVVTPSPKAEDQLFAWAPVQGTEQIVSTEFGESEWLEDVAGYMGLRRCIRRAAASEGPIPCDLGQQSVQITRVFKSDDVVREPGIYTYATKRSTPISIYSMSAATP